MKKVKLRLCYSLPGKCPPAPANIGPWHIFFKKAQAKQHPEIVRILATFIDLNVAQNNCGLTEEINVDTVACHFVRL